MKCVICSFIYSRLYLLLFSYCRLDYCVCRNHCRTEDSALHGALHAIRTALICKMAQLAPQHEVVLDFENQTLIELLSEDGLVIMARYVSY